MKKIFIAALALAAVAACNKAEVIDMAPQKAISFESPFVDNSTKAIDPSWNMTAGDAKELESFYVYGFISNDNGSANIFNRVKVVKGATEGVGNSWKYATESTQYWYKDSSYEFAAVVGGDVTCDDNGMPSEIDYENDQTDLLYAYNDYGIYNSSSSETEVAFTFNHLLSKAKFSFTNGYPEQYSIEISNVVITNPYKTGKCTIGTSYTWSDQASAPGYTLSFGNVVNATSTTENDLVVKIPSNEGENKYSSNYERLLIPGTYTEEAPLVITFTVNTYFNNLLVGTKNYTSKVAITLAPGNSYNFTAEIKEELEEITFKVETTGSWTNSNQSITVN